MATHDDDWFPAKRYGWGRGLPTKWQGWLVWVAFITGVALCTALIRPAQQPLAFAAAVSALVAHDHRLHHHRQEMSIQHLCFRVGESDVETC